MLFDLTCMVNVRQSAFASPTHPCVSVVWALMDMTLKAFKAFVAIAEDGEAPANRSGGADSDMRITTSGIGTFASKEMQTCGDAFRNWIM